MCRLKSCSYSRKIRYRPAKLFRKGLIVTAFFRFRGIVIYGPKLKKKIGSVPRAAFRSPSPP